MWVLFGTLLNWTHVFDGCVVWCGPKNKHHKNARVKQGWTI